MTVKLDVFQAVKSGNPDWDDLLNRHPGLKKRVVGKGTIQISFHAHKWIDLDVFMREYPEGYRKRLNDLSLVSSKILSGEEFLRSTIYANAEVEAAWGESFEQCVWDTIAQYGYVDASEALKSPEVVKKVSELEEKLRSVKKELEEQLFQTKRMAQLGLKLNDALTREGVYEYADYGRRREEADEMLDEMRKQLSV